MHIMPNRMKYVLCITEGAKYPDYLLLAGTFDTKGDLHLGSDPIFP